MKEVMSIEDIRGVAAPEIVELSGWNGDDVFVCKLRKAGIFAMQMAGGIPNPVLATIQIMFQGKQLDGKKEPKADELTAKAFYHIARACLVEPSMTELEAAGIQLTDLQLTEIYAYRLGGVPNLQRFRDSLRPRTGEHGDDVPDAPVGADGSGGSTGKVDGGRGDHGTKPARKTRRKAPATGEGNEVG